ncbi:hypothetical protein PFISCL1PPCAC_22440 [Pristionchus fissidentatus]|uniref:Amine oxidase n=1 Tax=Pristionchus fissidentatus TaxID=1538716 RepID=A0AAV5WI96_9BILA|nr:hypothetical protein PFISCL1PPCAC_22440 [Pristionchus fissidentatus]
MTRTLIALLLFLGIATVSSETVDVVVVGGGLAGLAAAREYASLRPDHTVVVLEARTTLGGRVHSVEMFTGNDTQSVDIGAQWISPSHTALIQLVQSLGFTLETQTSCGEQKVYEEAESHGRFARSTVDSSIPFEQMIRAAETQQFSGQSVKDWMASSNMSENEMHVVHRLLQTVLDAPESSVSALQPLLMASSEGGNLGELLAGNGHGQGMRVKEGLGAVVTAFSKGIGARLNEAVLSVTREDNGTVTVRTVKGEYSAKQVIIAVPPSLAGSIHFLPPLPHNVSNFLQSYASAGHAFYFAVTYNHPWWRANNVSGETVYGSRAGPLTWMTTFDTGASSECGTCGTSSGILWGIAHFGSPTPSSDKRKELITRALLRTMIYADAEEDLVDYKDYQFSRDEYLGGTVGVLPPSSDLAFILMLNNSINHGPVHFASAELSTASLGMMNGALLSGKRAAHAVDAAIERPIDENGAAAASSASHDSLYDAVKTPSLSDLLLPVSAGVTSFSREQEATTPPSVEESIDEPKIESPLRDSPVKSTTPFVYTTSTFYPTTTPAHEVDATTAHVRGPGDFKYSTSTQYPVDIGFRHDVAPIETHKDESISDQQPAVISASHDAPVSKETEPLEPFEAEGFEYHKNLTDGFDYSTSTQYPPTTTVSHTAETVPQTASGGFDYHTSTQYPPSESTSATVSESTVASSSNEDEEPPAKMAVLKNEQMVPSVPSDISGEIRTTNGAAFNYSTSTQYPPVPTQKIVPLVHFSTGNSPQTEFSVDEPVQHADEEKVGVPLRDHVLAEGSGEEVKKDSTVEKDTVDHVALANSAMQTLEKEVPLLPKEESAGIGERLLELLRKIMRILKGE